jgi:hypothetical protein
MAGADKHRVGGDGGRTRRLWAGTRKSRSLVVYGSLAREICNCVTGDHGRVRLLVGGGRGKRGLLGGGRRIVGVQHGHTSR